MSRPDPSDAGHALGIRRAVLPFLAKPGSRHSLETLQDTEAPAWELFLRTEHCASLLLAALPAGCLSRPIDGLLRRFATDEAKRGLSAAATLRQIAEIAAPHGWRVIVLKGGVTSAAGQPLHLADVDVLLESQVAPVLAERLAGTPLRPAEGLSGRSLDPVAQSFSLPVEIHTAIDTYWTALTRGAWTDPVPLAPVPGLLRQSPARHVCHLLSHIAVDHPDRLGRLRDVFLIRDAIAECSGDDREAVFAWMGGHPAAISMGELWNFAESFRKGAPPADPFERVALANYWLAAARMRSRRPPSPARAALRMTGSVILFARIVGGSTRMGLRERWRSEATGRSSLGAIAALERAVPPLGRLARRGVRLIHYGLAWLIARRDYSAIDDLAQALGIRAG